MLKRTGSFGMFMLVLLVAGLAHAGDADLKAFLEEVKQAPLQGVTVAVKTVHETNAKGRFTIDARYPVFSGLTDPAAQTALNTLVTAAVNDAIAKFKRDISDWNRENATLKLPTEGENARSDLAIDHTVVVASPTEIGILFQASCYFAMSAHPSSNFFVINFDLDTGRPVALADLFRPGAPYLKALSDRCVADLKKQQAARREAGAPSDYAMIREGAAPDAKNYDLFLRSPQGLVVLFDVYQVAPYVEGPQKVIIPYSALKVALRSERP